MTRDTWAMPRPPGLPGLRINHLLSACGVAVLKACWWLSGDMRAPEAMLQLPEAPFDFMRDVFPSQQPTLSGWQQSSSTPLPASGHLLLGHSSSLFSTPFISTVSVDTEALMISAQDCPDTGCSGADTHSKDLTCACLSLTSLERQLRKQSMNHAIWAYDHDGSKSEVTGWARAPSPTAAPATPSPTMSCTTSSGLSALATPFRPALLRMGSGQGSEASSSGPPVAPQTPPQRGTSDTELRPCQDGWGSQSDEDL